MTAITWTRLDSASLREANTWFRKSANPTYNEPQLHRILLLNGSFSNTSTWESILAGELLENNGYQRSLVTFNEPSINAGVVTLDTSYYSITATGLSLQFNCIALVADASAIANKSVVSMVAATDLITVTGHGLNNGDQILFTGDGTIATGLTKDTIYYVRDVSTNTFKVAVTSGGSAIVLTADSSGDIVCRYANGWPENIGVISPIQTILNGATSSFNVVWEKS